MTWRGKPIRLCLIAAVAGLVMVAGIAAVRPAVADPVLHEKKHDAKQQVEALEEQWRVAQLAGDTATMEKMLSDDYLGISMTGEVDTKTQQINRMTARRLVLSKIELSDMKVKLVGAVAIVTSQAQVEGTNDGMSVKGTYRYTRIYRRLPNGQWKITSFEATREHHHRQDVSEDPANANPPSGGGHSD